MPCSNQSAMNVLLGLVSVAVAFLVIEKIVSLKEAAYNNIEIPSTTPRPMDFPHPVDWSAESVELEAVDGITAIDTSDDVAENIVESTTNVKTPAPSEREWQKQLAPKYAALMEHQLWDRTRVDLLNSEYAIEIDFAKKWAEAIGQALYYAEMTGKKPGIILLVKTDLAADAKFVYRCQTVCARYGIKLWVEQ